MRIEDSSEYKLLEALIEAYQNNILDLSFTPMWTRKSKYAVLEDKIKRVQQMQSSMKAFDRLTKGE